MPIDQIEFRAAMGRFASGVTVVTTKDADNRLHGITVSAFCSVSLVPPLVLICIEKSAGSHAAIIESKAFVVNILSLSQAALSERFAAPLNNKFNDVEFDPGIDGIPVLLGCLANLECRVQNSCDGGDHTIFVAEVENVKIDDREPLVYFHSGYRSIDG